MAPNDVEDAFVGEDEEGFEFSRMTSALASGDTARYQEGPVPGTTSGRNRGLRTPAGRAGRLMVMVMLRRLFAVPVAVAVLAVAWWLRVTEAGPRRDRLATLVTAAAAVVLVPWTIGIAAFVPPTAVARHWDAAWTGLDVALIAGLTATCWLRWRRNPCAVLAATATATLMAADAWFDLCTSPPGAPFALAAACAVVELTVAAACLRLGWRAPAA